MKQFNSLDEVIKEMVKEYVDDCLQVKFANGVNLEEEMKKFTQGFAYKPSKEENEWMDFLHDKPKNDTDVWLSDGRSVIYIHKWGDADLDNYEHGYVWQYCDTPELPVKEKEKHECIHDDIKCLLASENRLKLFTNNTDIPNHWDFVGFVNVCPICGFSLDGEDEMD